MISFRNWLTEHDKNIHMPCDQVLPAIAQAGPGGISVEELRKRFEGMETLLEWLKMLEQYGAIEQFIVGEKRFYRAASS